jgi:23S rRNA pseudouridine1911/1915/1917 synthase
MAYIGHPLVGDPVYGYKKQKYKLKGQALHARTLGFIHPSKGEYMEFTAPLPKYFESLIIKVK